MSQIQRANEIPTASLGDELLMISVERDRYFSLNAVGNRIWELLADPTTQEQIAECLLSEYEVPAEVCSAQVGAFLDVLRQRSLVRDVT